MLTVGDKFPEFDLVGVDTNDLKTAFKDITFKPSEGKDTYEGKWKVIFFWPKDFTFVCPTEIVEFGNLNSEFADRDVQVLGASTDSEFVHLAWRNDHEDLGKLPFPMLADIKRELSESLGILDRDAGVALRATFVVDPHGVIQHASVNNLNVGRNPAEILRIVDALQTDELCPCNWEQGEDVISL